MKTCDHKGCTADATRYCGCERCDREQESEAFFACEAHLDEVAGHHRRVRGEAAKWFVGTAANRASYLRA